MSLFDARRRRVLNTLTAGFALGALGRVAAAPERSAPASAGEVRAAASERVRSAGGRLGFHAIDCANGDTLSQLADERFALCSTFKLPLAASILREADAGRIALDQVIEYGEADMVPHAPVTQRHLAEGGLRVVDLARAAQVTSDNVAANLLIRHLGGPQRVTALFGELGDARTRIDRYEPEMNRVQGDDPRDTTTPEAMAGTVARLFTTALLQPASRELLRAWMIETDTGLKRLRAGLPATWIAGDKTGTASAPGMPNRHNDVAVIWFPRRPPVVIAAYYEAPGHFASMRAEDDAVLADVGHVVASWIGAKSQ